MVAACSRGRARWTSNVRLSVSGDRLQWSSGRGTQNYVRCEPAMPAPPKCAISPCLPPSRFKIAAAFRPSCHLRATTRGPRAALGTRLGPPHAVAILLRSSGLRLRLRPEDDEVFRAAQARTFSAPASWPSVSNTFVTMRVGVEAGLGVHGAPACRGRGRRRAGPWRAPSQAALEGAALGEQLQDVAAEAADRALLDGDQHLVLAREPQDQLLVEGLGEARVGDRRR